MGKKVPVHETIQHNLYTRIIKLAVTSFFLYIYRIVVNRLSNVVHRYPRGILLIRSLSQPQF